MNRILNSAVSVAVSAVIYVFGKKRKWNEGENEVETATAIPRRDDGENSEIDEEPEESALGRNSEALDGESEATTEEKVAEGLENGKRARTDGYCDANSESSAQQQPSHASSSNSTPGHIPKVSEAYSKLDEGTYETVVERNSEAPDGESEKMTEEKVVEGLNNGKEANVKSSAQFQQNHEPSSNPASGDISTPASDSQSEVIDAANDDTPSEPIRPAATSPPSTPSFTDYIWRMRDLAYDSDSDSETGSVYGSDEVENGNSREDVKLSCVDLERFNSRFQMLQILCRHESSPQFTPDSVLPLEFAAQASKELGEELANMGFGTPKEYPDLLNLVSRCENLSFGSTGTNTQSTQTENASESPGTKTQSTQTENASESAGTDAANSEADPPSDSTSELPNAAEVPEVPVEPRTSPEDLLVHKNQCEEFKKRGNESYLSSEFERALEYYDAAISIAAKYSDEDDPEFSQLRKLCHSNKSMVRWRTENYVEVLKDCKAALQLDPTYSRVKLRAARCFLKFGLSKEAIVLCNETNSEGENSEALEIENCAKEMEKVYVKCLDSVFKAGISYDDALKSIQELMQSNPLSLKAAQIKTTLLLKMHRLDEAEYFCHMMSQWLTNVAIALSHDEAATNISPSTVPSSFQSPFAFLSSLPSLLKAWQTIISCRVSFAKGNVEQTLAILKEASRQLESSPQNMESVILEKDFDLAVYTDQVEKLQNLKTSANRQFKASKYSDAVQGYTAALAVPVSGESCILTSIIFNNRATALQRMGLEADAIDDCDCALALNPSNEKALSKRIELSRSIRDFVRVASDLEQLIRRLEYRVATTDPSQQVNLTNTVSELDKCKRLLEIAMENQMRKTPPDHYLILGADANDNPGQIKKAYRNTSLKHHPDKVRKFLPHFDSISLKEVMGRLEESRNYFFTLVKDAYDVLSNPQTKLAFDAEESIRNPRKRRHGAGSTSAAAAENHAESSQPASRRQRQSENPQSPYYGASSSRSQYHS